MAIRQYISDSSALFAFDLSVSQAAVRLRHLRPQLMGLWHHLTRRDGDVSLSSMAIH